MSQYLSTEAEEMVQVASNRGWSDLCEWVSGLSIDDHPSLHHLVKFGYDNDPGDLRDEVRAALESDPPADDIASTARGLADFADDHEDADIIIVSDGMTSDDE